VVNSGCRPTLIYSSFYRVFCRVITKLNLASDPFRNRTTPYLVSMLLLAVSFIAALLLYSQLNENRKLNEVATNQIREMKAEVDRLKGEGEKVQQQLSPQQRDLLVASHKLVANKSFGWSRLFYDIESVIPGSVSASRIVVQNVFREGDRVKAELDFTVVSRDYQAVMAMIANMNGSGVFQAELRGQNLQSNQRMTFSEYTLRLIYTPPAGVSQSSIDIAQTNSGGGVE